MYRLIWAHHAYVFPLFLHSVLNGCSLIICSCRSDSFLLDLCFIISRVSVVTLFALACLVFGFLYLVLWVFREKLTDVVFIKLAQKFLRLFDYLPCYCLLALFCPLILFQRCRMQKHQQVNDVQRVDLVDDFMLASAHQVKQLVLMSDEKQLSHLEYVWWDLDWCWVKPSEHQAKESDRGLLVKFDDKWSLNIAIMMDHALDDLGQRWWSDCHNALVDVEGLLAIDDYLHVAADLVVVDANECWSQALVWWLGELVSVGYLDSDGLGHDFRGSHISFFWLEAKGVWG